MVNIPLWFQSTCRWEWDFSSLGEWRPIKQSAINWKDWVLGEGHYLDKRGADAVNRASVVSQREWRPWSRWLCPSAKCCDTQTPEMFQCRVAGHVVGSYTNGGGRLRPILAAKVDTFQWKMKQLGPCLPCLQLTTVMIGMLSLVIYLKTSNLI